MAIPTVDWSKVDVQYMSLLQMIASLEQLAASINAPGTADIVAALDTFRDKIALEIEFQGRR